MSIVLGIDPGNNEVKIVGPNGELKFISDIGEARDIKLKNRHGEDDLIVEHEGRRLFAGSLARYESEFNGSLMGDSKAHDDAKLRVLIGLHKYCRDCEEVYLVTGQPIAKHEDAEKTKIKNMLQGRHIITVNGIRKEFYVVKAEIAPEGATAYWCNPVLGKIRILDVGSGTVNGATIWDKRYIDKDSFTTAWGANTNKTNDIKSMARAIAANALKKWDANDEVLLIGGLAEDLAGYMAEYFYNIKPMRPRIFDGHMYKELHPVYANAVGNYMLGRGIYGK